eukprot:512083-Pyramimonas_sp.AAC.1
MHNTCCERAWFPSVQSRSSRCAARRPSGADQSSLSQPANHRAQCNSATVQQRNSATVHQYGGEAYESSASTHTTLHHPRTTLSIASTHRTQYVLRRMKEAPTTRLSDTRVHLGRLQSQMPRYISR